LAKRGPSVFSEKRAKMNIKSNITLSEVKKRFNQLAPLPFCMTGDYEEEEHEGAFLHEGDLHLSDLSLDFEDYDEDSTPSVIIITGSLIVEGLIWNEQTDYGICLLVMKDLKAHDIVVGGQSICVWDRLEVVDILCGIYNHGDMHVKGDVKAQIIIADDFQMTCEGNFIGLKLGIGEFYHTQSDTCLEADIEDWDMIFAEKIFDEHGFSFENLVKCLKNKEDVRISEMPKDYDFLTFLTPIVTSSLVPKHHPYFLELSNQKLEIHPNLLILEEDNDFIFKYFLENEKVIVEKIEALGPENLKKLPTYLSNKAYRLLKMVCREWTKHEKIVEIRLSAMPHFYTIWDRLLEEKQREGIGRRVELALKNPAWYCEIYQNDCERRKDNVYTEKLYISAFIDAIVETGIAVSLNENQSIEDAKNALSNLKAFSTGYDERRLSHIKWGRKLFRFASDIISLNDTLPSNSTFIVREFRKSLFPQEFVFFLVDRKPFLDKNLKHLYETFQLS
jgi:hypothetical protein